MPEYHFDKQAADHVITFIETFCKHSKGRFARQPLRLLKWQTDLISQLFGWKDKTTHFRKYRQAGIWIPRKNGKTTMMASLALAMLLADDEPGPEVYIVATCREQAAILFDVAWAMIKQCPSLEKKTKVYKAKKQIVTKDGMGKMAILSSDADANVGQNASCIIFDELAFISDRRVYINLRSSQLARQQPLLLTISTASDKVLPGDIGKEQYEYAVAVRDGLITDPEFLPVIYSASNELPWDQPATWATANPSMGEAFDQTELAKLANEAKNSPIKQAEFEQFHLNRWRYETGAWLSKEAWEAAATSFPDLAGRECYLGADLARTGDLASFCLIFPIDGVYYILPRFFTPKDTIVAKENYDKVPYRHWASMGHLTLCPGNVIGDAEIKEAIREDAKKYKIEKIGYDPLYGESLFNQQLRLEDGYDVVQVRQGMITMGPPTAAFERLLNAGKIKHPNYPIFNWNAANASLIHDRNDNIMVAKMRNNRRLKVDGLQAAIVALYLILQIEDTTPQFFL